MQQPNLVFLAATTAAYALAFAGLQRSPLLPGPRLFLQAVGLTVVAIVTVRHLALL